jgi:hypothetical protein
MDMWLPEIFRNPNRTDQRSNSSYHIIAKLPSILNNKRTFKAARGKCHITYNHKPME